METTLLDLGKIKLTLAAISRTHYWRIAALPYTGPEQPPVPPEGYTADQARENLESFRADWDRYDGAVTTARIARHLGAARLEARDAHLIPELETLGLAKLCIRWSLANPDDEGDDPEVVGFALYWMAVEFGQELAFLEAHLWLQVESGGIDRSKVDAILKSLRRNREPPTDPGSGEPSPVEAPSGG